jgi:hypothetical protein
MFRIEEASLSDDDLRGMLHDWRILVRANEISEENDHVEQAD